MYEYLVPNTLRRRFRNTYPLSFYKKTVVEVVLLVELERCILLSSSRGSD
jgi:hypothetical protein